MQLSPRTDTAPLTLWPRNHFFVLLKTKATVAFTKHVLSNEACLSPTAGRDHKKKPLKNQRSGFKICRESGILLLREDYWMFETLPKHTAFVLRWPCAAGRMLKSGHQLTRPHMTSTDDWAVKYWGIYPAVYKQCRSKLILLEENFEITGHYSFT